MRILGLDHYNLSAPRELLESLRLFYTEVVGLTEGYRPPFEGPGYWLYAGDQPVLHLSDSGEAGDTYRLAETTFNHAAFRCSNRDKFEERLARLGIDYRVARIPELEIVQIFFSDPAGNGVELNFPNG